MNFFRSEDHVRNLKGFKEKKAGGIIALNDLMKLFSETYFKNRRNPDYFSNMGKYMPDFIATLDRLENAGNYWRMKWFEKLALKIGLKLGLM